MSGVQELNLTSFDINRHQSPILTSGLPHHSHEFDSAFYFDIWTLLASVGLLVVVVLINGVVFLTWRRQYIRGGYAAAAAADIHDNHFYFPNSSGNISFIDVGMVEETADTKGLLTTLPLVVEDVLPEIVKAGDSSRKNQSRPARQVKKWSSLGSTRNHQLDNDPDNGDDGKVLIE
ncbi:uncharacterized protein [Diadema antillarum]|uniref:uncharacterized protein n=1 Tax=Diadema antillarum TaxID=105358 RepID=UPI003A8A543C